MICCSNASSILAAPDLEAAIPQGDLSLLVGNVEIGVCTLSRVWTREWKWHAETKPGWPRKPPPPPPCGRPAALWPGLQRCSHRVALFAFGWATRLSPTRASFYIHFLAQEALSHMHRASLEPCVHTATREVLISHGNIFLPFRAPGMWPSWHIPRWAAEIAASFQAQVDAFHGEPRVLPARTGPGLSRWVHVPSPPRTGQTQAGTGPRPRTWGVRSVVCAPFWVPASFLAPKNAPCSPPSLLEILKPRP